MVIGFLLCLFFFSLVFFFYYNVDLFFFLFLFFGIVFTFVSIFQFFLRSFVIDWFIVVMFAVFFTLIFFFFANYFLYFIVFLSDRFPVFAWIGDLDVLWISYWPYSDCGFFHPKPPGPDLGSEAFKEYQNSSPCTDIFINSFFFLKGVSVEDAHDVLVYLEALTDPRYWNAVVRLISYHAKKHGLTFSHSLEIFDKVRAKYALALDGNPLVAYILDNPAFQKYLDSSPCTDILVNLFLFEQNISVGDASDFLTYLENMTDPQFWKSITPKTIMKIDGIPIKIWPRP